MIPPNKGSSLSLDSSLNNIPRENFYISGYESLNEILQVVPDRAWTLISVVKVSDPEGETMTRGSLCKFPMLNGPELSHRVKTIISPNW